MKTKNMYKLLLTFALTIILILIAPISNSLAKRRTAPRMPSRNPTKSRARSIRPQRTSKRTSRPQKSYKRSKRPPTYGSIRYSSARRNPSRTHTAKAKRNYRYYNNNKIQNKRTVQYRKRQRQETVSANRNTNRQKIINKADRRQRKRQTKKQARAKGREQEKIRARKSATPEQTRKRRKAIIGAAAAAGGASAIKNRKQQREQNKEKLKQEIKNKKGGFHVGGWKSRPKYRDKLPAKYAYLKHKGRPFYRHKYWWYRRCWKGDDIIYEPCYPPVGYYYSALPPSYETVVIHGQTYYRDEDGVYYTDTEQDGQKGYAVAEPPQEDITETLAENTEIDSEQQEPAEAEQQSSEQQEQTKLVSEEQSPEKQLIDSKAIDILKKMGDFIAKQKKFTFQATNTLDEISDSGKKTQTITHQTFYINRADGQKLACDIKSDKKNRYFAYDGQKIILYDKDKNAYAVIDAPKTIDSMLDMIIAKYGVNLPLIDILFDDPFLAMSAEIETGKYIGTEKIEGKECHHLAFTQDAIDWQVWIQTGNKPLPEKLIITYKNLEGTPRFESILSKWNLSPEFKAEQFDFKPPKDAEKIEIEPADNDNL